MDAVFLFQSDSEGHFKALPDKSGEIGENDEWNLKGRFVTAEQEDQAICRAVI